MRNVNKLDNFEPDMNANNARTSKLRMQLASDDPELIAEIFEGDPQALEAFTNIGGMTGKVTQVVVRDQK